MHRSALAAAFAASALRAREAFNLTFRSSG
jgi:hypothetical protein